MELGKERKETIYKFDLDVTPNEAKMLRDLGLHRIQKDDSALIEYAVVSLLEEKIKNTPIEEPSDEDLDNEFDAMNDIGE